MALARASASAGRGDAAPVQKDVDVDEHPECNPGADCRAREGIERLQCIDRHGHPRRLCDGGDARHLGGIDDLIRDQHIVHARRDHRLRFADRRAGKTDGGAAELPPCKLRRSMRLDVRPDGLARSLEHRRHRRDVRLEHVEVNHQGRSREWFARSRAGLWRVWRDRFRAHRAASRSRTPAYRAPRSRSGSNRRPTATSSPTASETDG